MKKRIVLFLAFCLTAMLLSEGIAQEKKLSFVGQTGNYAESVRVLGERRKATTGVTIEVNDVAYAALHENIVLDLTSGASNYDMVMTNASWLEECAQYFIDLEPYLQAAGVDLSKLSKSTLDACRINGKLMAVPVAPTPNMMAYRTDLVPTPPKTWEEYLDICKKYTKPEEGMYGVSLPGNKNQCAVLFLVRLWSMGQDVADKDWTVQVNNETGKKAMQTLKDTFQYADPACLTWGLNEAHSAFLQGKAVFCEAWPTLGIAQKADNPELSVISGKWAIAPFPADKAAVKQMSLQCLGVPVGCKDTQAAIDFIVEYISEAYQEECYKTYSTLPSLLAFYEKGEIVNSPLAALGEGLRGICLTKWNVFVSAEQDTIMTNAVGSFTSGEKTLDETMSYYADSLTKAIKNFKPEGQNLHAVVIEEAVKQHQ